jgi:phosphatidylserine/phosphatidylglycerophosphate/cardiolipin synthase-like enzyme
MKILCCGAAYGDYSDDDEVEDKSASSLSYVGTAAYDVLRKKHNWFHHQLWNVTSGKIIGEVHQTPKTMWKSERDPPEGHDDWFPQKMGEILSRTEQWADVMSLGPPDGLFLEEFKKALSIIADRSLASLTPVIIRMMFGNIVGMPINCNAIIQDLTADLPENANIQVWVGAWRKGVSWNHAKIIAVDGRYLHTGGHNMWDAHYVRRFHHSRFPTLLFQVSHYHSVTQLKNNPVHDLSLEMEGRVAHDGHMFANDQWLFIEVNQRTCCGAIVNRLPDDMWICMPTRVTVSEYPIGKATVFPPRYEKNKMARYDKPEGSVPIIAMGRYGTLIPFKRPSDEAFLAMFDSAKTIIRMALQDLGPVCIPGTKVTLPGCVWPKAYMSMLGKVIWTKGVDVEIALSNPNSIPGGLTPMDANYGNGWSCVDVASEIIKTIKKQFPEAQDDQLRQKVAQNLRVCFIREQRGNMWEDGMTMGMHAKHFIVDDISYYIGSQNLYICDLAEWGVVVDDANSTKKIMEEYWNPMWEYSHIEGRDVDVQEVMDGLKINRDAEAPHGLDALNLAEKRRLAIAAARHSAVRHRPGESMGQSYLHDEETVGQLELVVTDEKKKGEEEKVNIEDP